MSINFPTLQSLTIPEGKVKQITDASGRVIWGRTEPVTSDPVILEVEKITSNTYAGSTTYTGEEFILLDIYPKTNGTVNVTYGGLTKTITDTSGAEEPNAQQVFFGTFNGVSDSVTTPASGELTIEGDCYAFGCSSFASSSKALSPTYCLCVTKIISFGNTSTIPTCAFSSGLAGCEIITLEIPDSISSIGDNAFNGTTLETVTIGRGVEFIGYAAFATMPLGGSTTSLKNVKILKQTPPTLGTKVIDGEEEHFAFGSLSANNVLEEIIVPKGCAETYKSSKGWSEYAAYIVEVNE